MIQFFTDYLECSRRETPIYSTAPYSIEFVTYKELNTRTITEDSEPQIQEIHRVL